MTGFVERTILYNSADTSAKVVETQLYYDGASGLGEPITSGNVTKEIVLAPDGSEVSHKSLDYDSFGNIITQQIGRSVADDGQLRIQSFSYDSQELESGFTIPAGLFLTSVTDPLGFVVTHTADQFLQPKTTTPPNGCTVRHAFDPFTHFPIGDHMETLECYESLESDDEQQGRLQGSRFLKGSSQSETTQRLHTSCDAVEGYGEEEEWWEGDAISACSGQTGSDVSRPTNYGQPLNSVLKYTILGCEFGSLLGCKIEEKEYIPINSETSFKVNNLYLDAIGQIAIACSRSKSADSTHVCTTRFYNANGKVQFESVPVENTEPLSVPYIPSQVAGTSFKYDLLGRVVEEDFPGLGLRRTVYLENGYREEIYEGMDLVRFKQFDTDAFGNVIRVIEELAGTSGELSCSSSNSALLVTSFDYNLALGKVENVTLPDQTQPHITIQYDPLGRERFMTDLNRGTIRYVYNEVGELEQSFKNEGTEDEVILSFLYDAAGRKFCDNLNSDGICAANEGDTHYIYDDLLPELRVNHVLIIVGNLPVLSRVVALRQQYPIHPDRSIDSLIMINLEMLYQSNRQ